MEARRNTQTATCQARHDSIIEYDSGDQLTEKRLAALLAANDEIARDKSLFHSEQEKTEAALIRNPLTAKQTFAYFGLLLGTFPPAAIFARLFWDAGNIRGEDFWLLGVAAVVNLISAIVGYFSGNLIGKIVSELEKQSWSRMIFALPFIGMLWGIIAGGAGGVIVLGVGAFFGALLGAAVGATALPVFTIFHRLLKKGDLIDRQQFLPVAFGVTFIVCALVLGL